MILWREQWQDATQRLQAVETAIQTCGTSVVRGGDYDHWDLEVRGGLLGAARMLAATEEHGAGRQLVRFRVWPRCSVRGLLLTGLFGALTTAAALEDAWHSAMVLGVVGLLLLGRTLHECAGAMATMQHGLDRLKAGDV
jgi:hypothetical protein